VGSDSSYQVYKQSVHVNSLTLRHNQM
jgi:hypothetical protein